MRILAADFLSADGRMRGGLAREDDNLPLVTSLDELEAYIRNGIVGMEKDLEFSYTAALDEVFSTREGSDDLIFNVGSSDLGGRSWDETQFKLADTAY